MRCCSDNYLPGHWNKNSGCSVWGGSDAWGSCVENQNFAAAAAICSDAGARLCTVAELKDDCTKGSGCGFDVQLVWASP